MHVYGVKHILTYNGKILRVTPISKPFTLAEFLLSNFRPLQTRRSLLVEKILAARLIEVREIRGPAGDNLLWSNSGLKLSDGF